MFTDFFGAYETAKKVRLYDCRLRAIQLGLVLAAIVYTLTTIIISNHHIRFESPSAFVNAWPGFASDVPVVGLSHFCHNESYEVFWRCYDEDNWDESPGCQAVRNISNKFYVKNPSCAQWDEKRDVSVTSNAVNVVTLRSVLKFECALEDANGRCLKKNYNISSRQSFLLEGVDAFRFHFMHSCSTSWGLSATDVATTIYNSDGKKVAFFAAGMPVGPGIDLRQWVEWAGFDLDTPNYQAAVTENPLYRSSGAFVVIRMKYSNYRDYDSNHEVRCEITPQVMPAQWGYSGVLTDDHDPTKYVVENNSVMLHFLVGGTLGKFDFFLLVSAMVNGFVLFSIATVVVDRIAMHCLVERHAFRKAKFEEHLDLRRLPTLENLAKPLSINNT